jgi:hypothetical protein
MLGTIRFSFIYINVPIFKPMAYFWDALSYVRKCPVNHWNIFFLHMVEYAAETKHVRISARITRENSSASTNVFAR